MLAGYYTIASSMMTQQKKLDVIGNNVVNSQTPGFRADRVMTSTFDEQLALRLEAYNTGAIGTNYPMTIVEEVPTVFHSGNVKDTGRNFDLAINGDGYFNIQAGDQGVLLTRNGQFDADEQGYLVLPGVGRVLGENGPIQVFNSNFRLESDGTIYNENGQRLDRLQITIPAEGANAVKLGNGLYRVDQTNPVQNTEIIQGSLELSNVDFNREYSLLMEAQRAFQACSSALQVADELNQKAATQIAAL